LFNLQTVRNSAMGLAMDWTHALDFSIRQIFTPAQFFLKAQHGTHSLFS